MLHVHRAERADRLAAALADVLAVPPDDPLTTEVVSVHSRGIERWIAQELATRLGAGTGSGDGVCANVDFPFPSRLVHSAVAAGSGVDPDRDPWLPERLTWPLLEVVDAAAGVSLGGDRRDLLGPLWTHVGGGGDGDGPARSDRRFGAVRHVADLFDRYGVHRPDMIRRWARGEDTGPAGEPLAGRHRWQPRLWRAVRDRLDVPSLAERIDAATALLRTEPDRLQLPGRLALFGLTALPATYLTVLGAIAAHRDVHLMLLHPSPALWARVADDADGGQTLIPRAQDPTRDEPDNPLLGSWGRDVRELQLITPVPEDPGARHHHAGGRSGGDARPGEDPGGTGPSLLGRIQADVRADRFPGPRRPRHDGRPRLAPDDTSLQVHACHGRLRQVEVLHDAILHLLADDPTLEPRDIIVMCPDIETFAPLVTAVFGAEAVTRDGPADGGLPRLRVRLADRSIRRTNPVLEVVALLLELADGRMAASEVLDLAGRGPVRRRFDLDDEQLETLESWVADLGVRWGLDDDHRRRRGLPALDDNTWRAGLERLHLGVAMADEDLRLVDGVAPFDDVEGGDTDLAGRLTELVTRLDAVVADLTGPQPVAGWRRAISRAADLLTATTPDTRWQRLQLQRILGELVDESRSGGSPSGVGLTLGEVRRLLDDRLRGRPSRTGHRTGDLTVCTLVPMRSVPHRVVCLLGLDDEVFPRQTVPDSDDLLQQAPRVGDRDPRSEDRQLLLDALLAATDTLVVTYTGRDERTNETRPPAVPVDELLDVVDRTVTTGDDDTTAARAVTTWHPLATHDPRSFTPGRLRPDGRPWSFDPAGLAAARAGTGPDQDPPPFLSGELELPDEDVLDLDDLVAFLQHPVRAFVRQRLGVSLPTGEDQLPDAIPSSLRGLEAWRVGQQLLDAWMRGQDPGRALAVVRARRLLPPGRLGGGDVDTVRERVGRIRRLCGHLEVSPRRRRPVDVEIDLGDGRTLIGTVPDVADWRIEAVSYSRLGAKHRLAAWARLLAVTADQPARPWQAVTVGRHSYKRGAQAQAAVLPGLGADEAERAETARRQLARLVDLYDRGRREPVPLYCNSSHKSATRYRRAGDPRQYVHFEWETNPYQGFEKEDRDPYHLLVLGRQLSTDELFEEPPRDAEEAGWADTRSRFAAYAWRLWEPILRTERLRSS